MFQFFFKYPMPVFSKGKFVLLGAWPGWVLLLLILVCVAGLAVLIWSRLPQAAANISRWRAGAVWLLQSLLIATVLALLPLTLLGAWKPRLAGYLLAASFVVALAYPMRGAQGLGDAFKYLFWAGTPALPMALVAALYFYASTGSQPGPPIDNT